MHVDQEPLQQAGDTSAAAFHDPAARLFTWVTSHDSSARTTRYNPTSDRTHMTAMGIIQALRFGDMWRSTSEQDKHFADLRPARAFWMGRVPSIKCLDERVNWII